MGGVDLSGQTPDQARATLDTAYGATTDGKIKLVGPDGTTVITYAEIGRRLDTEALVDQALAVGRDGSAIDRAVANARTAVRGVDLEPRVTFDAEKLASRINAVAAGLRIQAVEASVKANETLDFEVVAGRSGRVVDASEVAASIATQLAELEAPAEVSAKLPVTVIEPDVTTAEATKAEAAAERIAADITLVVGKKKTPIDTKKLRPWITFATTADGGYAPVVDTTKLPTLLKGLAKKINKAAINATFTTSGSRITGVKPSKDGYKLDTAATAKQIEALLATRAIGTASKEIRPALAVTKPALTTAEARPPGPRCARSRPGRRGSRSASKNNFGANIWIPALTHQRLRRRAARDVRLLGCRRAGHPRQGLRARGRDHQRQDRAAGRARRRHLLVLHDALQRRPAGRLHDGRPAQPLLLHRPLPDRPRRDGLQERLRLDPDDVVHERHGLPGPDPRLQDPQRQQGLRPVRPVQRPDRPQGLDRPADHQEHPPRQRHGPVHVVPVARLRRSGSSIPVDGKQVWRTVTVRDSKGKVIHRKTYYSNYRGSPGSSWSAGAPTSPRCRRVSLRRPGARARSSAPSSATRGNAPRSRR